MLPDDRIENCLQTDLFSLLEVRYGKGNVMRDRDHVDITVTDGPKTILIEFKSDPTPRAAIREAIGQLLEYAYYRPLHNLGELHLIIIALGNPDKHAEAYIQRLRTEFKLPIWSCCYSEGAPLPEVFGMGMAA